MPSLEYIGGRRRWQFLLFVLLFVCIRCRSTFRFACYLCSPIEETMPATTRACHHQAQSSPSSTRRRQTTTAHQSVPGSGTRLARFRQAARQRQSQPTRRTHALVDDSRQELLDLIRGEFRALTESRQPREDLQPVSTSSASVDLFRSHPRIYHCIGCPIPAPLREHHTHHFQAHCKRPAATVMATGPGTSIRCVSSMLSIVHVLLVVVQVY